MGTREEQVSALGRIIELEPRGKRPTTAGWPDLGDSQRIRDGYNRGLHLGPSGVTDVDLDSPEAIRLAPLFLPTPHAVIMRGETPTHYMYRIPDPPSRARLALGSDTLIELRSGYGVQTMIPPSVHPSGQRLSWAPSPPDCHLAQATGEALSRGVRRIAACVALERSGTSPWEAMTIVQGPPVPVHGPWAHVVREWLGWAPRRPTVRPMRRESGYGSAVRAYVGDHPGDYPPRNSDCPMCGGARSFKAGARGRWVCWSAHHGDSGAGQDRGDYWVGDSLDMDAHASGSTPAEHLRAAGYL